MTQVINAGATYYKWKITMQSICLCFLGIICIAVAIWSVMNNRSSAAKYMKKTIAEVISTDQVSESGKTPKFTLMIHYEYTIGETKYLGDHDIMGLRKSELNRKKRAIQDGLLVRYDPKNPIDSLVDLPTSLWWLSLVGIGMIGSGIAMFQLRNNKYAQGMSFASDVAGSVRSMQSITSNED